MKSSALIKERDHYEISQSINDNFESVQAEIRLLIKTCAQEIVPVWPLETFIACNPLQGFEARSFEEALTQGNLNRERQKRNVPLEEVNLQMIKWCGGFLDAGQGAIEMPHRDKGFYQGFLALAYYDKQLHRNKKELKHWIKNLPKTAEEAVHFCLEQLGVDVNRRVQFIKQTLQYLPGWAGYVKWRSEWKNIINPGEKPVTLTDFVAIRLVITCLMWPDAAQEKKKKKVVVSI
ncbi:putative inorganic carbon transporter subunit DabA [Legionella jamestowniensis]|uniref:Uncharacterized protein n=1 Tax=Legionella jamestowniensis TaxID=455 RepID=A0A0W0UHV7_9GAMM|nr:putative inorganic carbon transporter subunit DabA [Legionella jamestowniensis]KTD07459.1 hypothetical protein Ljam_1654 [Legionella jamestowniensis]